MLRGPRFVVFYRIVIDTDHLTNVVQDYSIGRGANILLHQSDITKWTNREEYGSINHLNPPKPEYITTAKQNTAKPCGFMGYTTTLVK